MDQMHPTGSRPDPASFAAIYQQYAEPIYRYFLQHTGNPHDAEDLAATTFSKALSSLHRYEEHGRFVAWLFSIARHTLRDWQRRQRPHLNVDAIAPLLPDPAPAPDELLVADEQARDLHRMLSQLPAEQRQALVLRFFDGLSNGEVATVLGRSIGSVKMLIHRAVGRLRSQYQRSQQTTFPLSLLLTLQPALRPVRISRK